MMGDPQWRIWVIFWLAMVAGVIACGITQLIK